MSARKTQITSNDQLIFTSGACHLLAHEINELTGWPIHCFMDEPNYPAPCHHAFIVPRKGWRLDVNGFQPAVEHNGKWTCVSGKHSHKKFSYGKIVSAWGGAADWLLESEEEIATRAKELAPHLVALARKSAETDLGGALKMGSRRPRLVCPSPASPIVLSGPSQKKSPRPDGRTET